MKSETYKIWKTWFDGLLIVGWWWVAEEGVGTKGEGAGFVGASLKLRRGGFIDASQELREGRFAGAGLELL